MLDFSHASFTYEPYPIGVVRPVFEPGLYRRLAETFPPPELFEHMPHLGDKYSLSPITRTAEYERFVAGVPEWKRFYDYVRGDAFVPQVLAFLERHHIDIGLRRYSVVSRRRPLARPSLISRVRRKTEVSARLEFAMMGASGGHILPHSDSPQKLITMVFSMIGSEGWNPAWGGGTDVVLPSDRSLVYNHMNRSLPFADVDTIGTCAFEPNQCVVFIKTFNSWHSVAPMTAPGPASFRKTLTVNIEARV